MSSIIRTNLLKCLKNKHLSSSSFICRGGEVIMIFYDFLSFEVLSNICPFTIRPRPCSCIHLCKDVRYNIRCFLQNILPSIYPLGFTFANHTFLIISSRNFKWPILILCCLHFPLKKRSSFIPCTNHSIFSSQDEWLPPRVLRGYWDLNSSLTSSGTRT